MPPKTPRNHPPLPRDGIYRAILAVLAATVAAGALIAIAGETVYHDPVLARAGTGLALVAGAIYAFFRILGAREARRRNAHDADDDDVSSGRSS